MSLLIQSTNPMSKSFSSNILMIRPAKFAFNAQTAGNNAFQKENQSLSQLEIQKRALSEFDGMADILRKAGVNVLVFQDTPEPHTPDSIFPNNWVSFHSDGSYILYPMYAENRRLERNPQVLEFIKNNGFKMNNLIDYTAYELKGKILEGTGSLILDRDNLVAYACRSPRTNLDLLNQWGQEQGYKVVAFDSVDENGHQIYHTNVMMCLGDGFAILVEDSIKQMAELQSVQHQLIESGREIIKLSYEQMNHFAGNMLQVRNNKAENILVLSQQAYNALSIDQVRAIEKYSRIVYAAINEIEQNGGGSARCMMAEIFLPKN